MLGLGLFYARLGWTVVMLSVSVPVGGALVRFKAHYNPKGLQLDSEGDIQPHTGPVISSFFGMLRRIHRIEGWPGLYKGLMPALLSILVVLVHLMIILSQINLRYGKYSTPGSGVLGVLVCSTMLISLVLTIIESRAITTPHKLPYFNAIYSLRILLTPTERRRPWILYLTPGLFAAKIPGIAYFVLFWFIRQFILSKLTNLGMPRGNEIFVKFVIFLLIALLSTVILAPLEVIVIRLSIQRNHAAPEFNSISQEEDGDAEEVMEYAGVDEDVIGLRTDREPYVGLVDCAKRIIDEEGWSTLYRAWWSTTLVSLAAAYA